jgi:2-methylcitrate dehydratase PrpD
VKGRAFREREESGIMHTKQLAEFAAGLRFDRLPADVRERARECIQDTVGVIIFGAKLPWSKIMIDYAQHNAAPGNSSILSEEGARVSAPFAALANGVLTHAFEMDSLRKPSTGVHPGGIVPPALAVAEEVGASGKELISAFVAGMEVTTRIGLATRHSCEKRGFHAPGLTGVFGAAIASGKLLGLDAGRMCNALGIAGSLCSGLLEFAKSGGGMVKRLHLGRAAEGGVLAATLARKGFEGPTSVLEGNFGFLTAFAQDALVDRLAEKLGETWETRTICYKRCPCHITAHAPIQALEELRKELGFTGHDVERIVIGASRKVLSNHNIPEPKDTMAAQFSVPFSVALSFYRDPMDPHSFLDLDHGDPEILALSRKIRLEFFEKTSEPGQAWVCRVAVRLKDGRTAEKPMLDFRGSPTQPMSVAEFDAKFRAATRSLGAERADALLADLKDLENQTSVADLLQRAHDG